MAKTKQDVELWQGDAHDIVVTVYDEDKVIKPIDGASVTWALSEYATSPTLLTKTTAGGGVTLSDAPNGELTVELTASDTASLPGGKHYHEVKLTDGAGVPSTTTLGEFVVHPSNTD